MESKFRKDGELALLAEWEFVPVSSDNQLNWYKLRNRARPKEYASWVTEATLADNVDIKVNFLILESSYPGNRSRSEFLFRPVKMNEDENKNQGSGTDYYQLILNENQDGIITFSHLTYPAESYYLEVVNPVGEGSRERYDIGNDKYDLTLFTFELAEEGEINDEEDIEDININELND